MDVEGDVEHGEDCFASLWLAVLPGDSLGRLRLVVPVLGGWNGGPMVCVRGCRLACPRVRACNRGKEVGVNKYKYGRKTIKCCICGNRCNVEDAWSVWLNDGQGFPYGPALSCSSRECMNESRRRMLAIADREHHLRDWGLVGILEDSNCHDLWRTLRDCGLRPNDEIGRQRQSLVKWLMRRPRFVDRETAKLIASRKYPR